MKVQLGAGAVLAVAGVAVLGVLGWKFARQAQGLGAAIGDGVSAVAQGINPANPDNIVNRGVSAVGGAIVTDPEGPGKNADGSWTLGGAIFDVTHPDAWGWWRTPPIAPNTGGATGSWDEPRYDDYAVPGVQDYFAP